MISGMAFIWLILIILVVAKSKGSRPASRAWSSPLPPQQQTPDELARDRYARGEIDWPEYQEVLVNLLKDRYVRGDLELDEYEQRASLVLDGSVLHRREASAQLQTPKGGAAPVEPHGPAASALAKPVGETHAPLATPASPAYAEQRREPDVDSDLDALRRRFLTGALTYQEYEEERRRIVAA